METFGNQEREQEVALRTVPIILKNGNRRVTVNCLLDEGSDTTYVNEDVVNELGLIGETFLGLGKYRNYLNWSAAANTGRQVGVG